MNEEIAVAEYKNNVLVEQENAILEILECERKNCHTPSVREREISKKLEDTESDRC